MAAKTNFYTFLLKIPNKSSNVSTFLTMVLILNLQTCIVSSEAISSEWHGPKPSITTLKEDGDLTLTGRGFLDNITSSPALPIVSSCTAFIQEFSEAAAAFTKCSILHSRPLRFCEKCVHVYLKAKESYDLIMEGKFHDETGARCSDVILNSDRIQIVVQTHVFLERIWNDCYCEGCFVHTEVGYELSNETIFFFQLANNTHDCFNNYTRHGGNESVDPEVCVSCRPTYHEMNHYYDHIQEHSTGHLCMDIVDMMNSTRYEWSQVFHCTTHAADIVPVVLLTVFFCTLPIVFYVSNKVHGSKVQRKLFIQKRMTEVQSQISVEEEQPSTS